MPKLTSTPVASDPTIITKLHPHQQTALRMMLECEGELDKPDRIQWVHSAKESSWYHPLAPTVMYTVKPIEAPGSLLADDVCCLSAICK